jgi:hypothetical protein
VKVTIVFNRQLGQAEQSAIASSDAYWIGGSAENRALAEKLRKMDQFDPNSAVFDDALDHAGDEAVLTLLSTVDEHHPTWTEVFVLGAEVSTAFQDRLHQDGLEMSNVRDGFVVTRTGLARV